MPDSGTHFDVAIVGGGLAGLTLALQLEQESPELAIIVLERDRLPPPIAAHKVGESTVEIGAHYLSHTLGLTSLLERTQLRKFGLRFFFGSGQHEDLANADELGASNFLPTVTYQLDRGRLEGDLAEILSERGVIVKDSCNVKHATVSANGTGHELHVVRQERSETIRCRWIVDAAARSRFLKRLLDIGKPSRHRTCAAWFRLDLPIEVDDWSDCGAWKERCNRVPRKLSTNHLMGPGYWAWLIPLAGDRTSVGLVADPDIHPLSSFNSLDKFLKWASTFQPQFANRVAEAKDTLMDFKYLKNLSQDCRQVWSKDRWALTGESGVFADPFYSPGTDFIAIGNTFICDLIRRERLQSKIDIHVVVYQRMYQSFFESTMSLFEKQYAGFGDTRLMVIKSTWDYAYYWSVLAWLFFRELMTDIAFVKSVQPDLARAQALNATVQSEFRKRASENRSDCGKSRFFDQLAIPVLANLSAALTQPGSNPELELGENCRRLESLAPLLLSLLAESETGDMHDCSLLGDLRKRLS